jgi:uncharacterized protein (TIGR02246 family)
MSVAETLTELEERMWRANREGDGAFYAGLVRDDALVVSRYGVMGKDQIVAGIQANRNPYVKTELSEFRVVELGEDSALITYRAQVVALVNGSETELSVYATSVYVREGDSWRNAFHQQSAL